MKQKFALLTIVGALLALAVPAVSSASMYPASAKFEIPAGPSFSTSFGSCTVKVTGQVPKAPENEASSLSFPVTPSVSTCTSGMSTTLSGEWKAAQASVGVNIFVSSSPITDTVVIRSSTLPGCKLTNSGFIYQGIFANGTTTPKVMQSSYHAHGANNQPFTWANDGGTCAIAGTKDQPIWGSGSSVTSVKNLTTPATPIIASS